MTAAHGGERLHKRLADLGLGSRRAAERWIEQGKVTIDGRVARLGDKVGPRSRIRVDGRAVRATPTPTRRRVLLYHKPEGEITTRQDPGKRPTVFRRLPKLNGGRWVAVGRLDLNTRGLLLFTNDGQLANRLMHPRFGIEREYLCRVYGEVGDDAIARLQTGIALDRATVRFARVQRHGRGHGHDGGRDDGARNQWYSVVVTEGKYREIRRMWEAVGCQLSRLIRVRYGDLTLPRTLRPGQWAELKPAEVAKVLRAGAAVGSVVGAPTRERAARTDDDHRPRKKSSPKPHSSKSRASKPHSPKSHSQKPRARRAK
ncbi:MAG: pseudouridine synthase [bacterium]